MRKFYSLVLGLSASFSLILGGTAILVGSIFLAATVNLLYALGILLIPLWMAAMIRIIDYAYDLEVE